MKKPFQEDGGKHLCQILLRIQELWTRSLKFGRIKVIGNLDNFETTQHFKEKKASIIVTASCTITASIYFGSQIGCHLCRIFSF